MCTATWRKRKLLKTNGLCAITGMDPPLINQTHARKEKVEMSNDNRVSEVRTSQQEPEREQRIFTFKATQLVWLLFGILEVLIALRIGLKLIGANPDSPIVALIYGVTFLFLFPFTGLIGSPTVGNMELELSPCLQC